MSSHCYKKYAAFLPQKWLKTAYFCIEDVILLSQSRWGGCYVIATNIILRITIFYKSFHSCESGK